MSAVETVEEEEPNAWWTTLRHEGVLLSPPVLEDIFPDGPPAIAEKEIDNLRREYRDFRNNPQVLRSWLDTVFEDLLGHQSGWEKEQLVSEDYTYQDLRPNRVLLDGEDNPQLAVWIDEDRVTTDKGEPGRIGIYSGRRTYADLVKLLRNTGIPLGILTNGHQFRLVHATLDRESWSEWTTQAWFEGGEGRDTLHGYKGLLSDEVSPPLSGPEEQSLLGRIQESRERQADLSDVMGTQVRESVEMLLQELDSVLMEVDEETREEILAPLKERDINRQEELRARYQASIRIIMRLVVALYAESRELFPKENPVYYDSYSVEGLFRELREAKIEESEEALEKQYGAWPRLQSLSRLIYHGSPHPDIPMQSYGGRLFRPPSEDGEDDVLAGIEVFEHDEVRITDATILEILENLKIAEFRSGGSRRRGPVDFSELRTEYIGMMYEGLLDYDLREATEDDGAIVFLNIGDEPALPFNVLENLDDDGLEDLVDNLKDESSGSFLADEEVSEDDFDEEELEADEEDDTTDEDQDEETPEDIEARIHKWAKRVVEETGVYMPHHNTVRAMDPTIREKYEGEAARRLIKKIVRPGGTYLVSWEGTRKSTGTFYTPPGLAVPTVHRTLEPLVYESKDNQESIPKPPEEILDLKVCDPAMGSGTFPVAAIRYLTQGLKESFEEHVLPKTERGEPIAAPLGEKARGILNERLLSIRKGEDEDWEERLELQLKRTIVERCIYGVDINPLAVELGKLSIWIETMDPDLPFTFLDHKLRVGNSLIGTWIHEFEEYPAAAWNREGATEERTSRIEREQENVEDQLYNHIRNAQHDTSWFETDADIDGLIEDARESYESLHQVVNESEREQIYEEEFLDNEDINHLRHLMDRWCSIWFWPMEEDDIPVLDPDTFYNTERGTESDRIVREIANERKHRFFHWELEFPDVFLGEEWGFDAIVGNPPWEEPSPQNEEFFTRFNPAYRTFNTREKRNYEEQLFNSAPEIETQWNNYVQFFRNFKHFVSERAEPQQLSGRRTKEKTKIIEYLEKRFSPRERQPASYPYRRQKYTVNLYKLFLEQSLYITKTQGQLGMILPTGLFSGKETYSLREHLFDRTGIRWAYHFVNRKKIFNIEGGTRMKFSSFVSGKQSKPDHIKTQFMVEELSDWQKGNPQEYIKYGMSDIERFSPEWLNFLEFDDEETYEMTSKIYRDTIQLQEFISPSTAGREFNGTEDDDLLHKASDLEEDNTYSRTNKGLWLDDEDTQMLPVYSGSLIHQFDFAFQDLTDGEEGDHLPHDRKKILAEDYMKDADFKQGSKHHQKIRVMFRRIVRGTDTRSVIASLTPNYPAIESVLLFKNMEEGVKKIFLSGLLNSYIFDYAARQRIDNSASWYILSELPVPKVEEDTIRSIAEYAAKLNWHPDFFPDISEYTDGEIKNIEYVEEPHRRAKIREKLDQLIMEAYELDAEDMEWILREENEDPRNLWKDYRVRLGELDGEGKWGKLEEKEN